MTTDAQFHVGQTVWYRGDAGTSPVLAVILEVSSVNPAQYRVAMTGDSSVTTCGESPTEPGAVFAL